MVPLKLNEFLESAEAFHIALCHFVPTWASIHHTHDFVECFLVVKGHGIHWINGQKVPLLEKQLVFIRPQDSHHFSTHQREGFQLINLAFSQETLRFLQNRYFLKEPPFWGDDPLFPKTWELTPTQYQTTLKQIEALFVSAKTQLVLDTFLLNLFHLLKTDVDKKFNEDVPLWLSRAIDQIESPDYFQRGAQALAMAAHKSPEHVARVVRTQLQTTPSQLVNQARIRYASRELRFGNRDIQTIALDCGFQSLGQFYQLFKQFLGITPRQYRLQNQRIVVGTSKAKWEDY